MRARLEPGDSHIYNEGMDDHGQQGDLRPDVLELRDVRLGIAAELINCPPILMLDEPTSGLDAATANNLCRILSKYAEEKRVSVLMTIHQPRTQVA